jgi:quinol-cytochrome oxidoreductase complex cytochrome b subunit
LLRVTHPAPHLIALHAVEEVGPSTLTRFFALHVFVIPGVLIGLVGVHLLMVINLGVNEWPMPGRIVKRDTYLKEYHELVHKDGLPFVPVAFQKDVVFAGLTQQGGAAGLVVDTWLAGDFTAFTSPVCNAGRQITLRARLSF